MRPAGRMDFFVRAAKHFPLRMRHTGVTEVVGAFIWCKASRRHAMRFVIGGAGSSRETNDACRLQCFVVGLFSSIRTALVSGSSPPLHVHDISASHWQPSFSSQARSGWFSQTHTTPKQMGQFLSIAKSYLWSLGVS